VDVYYYQNGLSYHPTDRSYNEKNFGQGLGLRFGDDLVKELALGMYKNSINKDSKYADFSIHKRISDYILGGFGAGMVTGYGEDMPYILPSLRIGNKDYEANLRYAPKTNINPEVWMLNFGYRL